MKPPLDIPESETGERDKWVAKFLFVARYVPVLVEAYDENKVCIFWNETAARISGYSSKEIEGRPGSVDLLYPDHHLRAAMLSEFAVRGYDFRPAEWTMTSKDGQKHTISWFNLSKLFRPVPWWANWAIGIDLTPRLTAEAELARKHQELSEQSQRLIEVNAALNVLLQKQEEDRKALIADFITNHERLVLPFLGKLRETRLQPQQEALVDIIAENILTSTTSLGGPLSHIRSRLTITEFEVAGLIARGRSTLEIADVLHISPHTAGAHRNSIRRKLDLVKKGVNLAAHLQSAFLRGS